jgi:hypothetical protein
LFFGTRLGRQQIIQSLEKLRTTKARHHVRRYGRNQVGICTVIHAREHITIGNAGQTAEPVKWC